LSLNSWVFTILNFQMGTNLTKLKKNIQRDATTNERLQKSGWIVMRFWEHDMKNVSIVIEQIEKAIMSQSAEKVGL
jgi:G:T-mismatch repair DNA endonuclease (very short patch repair protein)